jgi:hypothetical protein
VDRAGIERLITSLRRLPDPPAGLVGTFTTDGGPGLQFVSSRLLGAT